MTYVLNFSGLDKYRQIFKILESHIADSRVIVFLEIYIIAVLNCKGEQMFVNLSEKQIPLSSSVWIGI